MNRNQWLLIGTVILLLVGNFIYHVWLRWGLITIHSKGDPLSKIVRQIEKQGHVTVKTNMDLTTPVKLWIEDYTVANALEALSTVTESRWRLTYVLAGDKSSINGAIATLTSGEKPDGWKTAYYPLMGGGAQQDGMALDPRKDPWNVKPVTESTAQSYLEQAARSVSASFIFPENWNPTVKSAPKSGPIAKSLAQLASAARGKYEEFFLLQKRQRTGRAERREGDEGDGGGGGPRFGGDDDGRRQAMNDRLQAEIDKQPPERRAELQREKDARTAFFLSLRDKTDDQRRALWQQFMNQPGNQDRMDNAQASRDAMSTPDQRMSRADGYLSNKAAATGGSKP